MLAPINKGLTMQHVDVTSRPKNAKSRDQRTCWGVCCSRSLQISDSINNTRIIAILNGAER